MIFCPSWALNWNKSIVIVIVIVAVTPPIIETESRNHLFEQLFYPPYPFFLSFEVYQF